MLECGEKLSVALSNLIDISEDIQENNIRDIIWQGSNLQRLKEFCTIKCCTSRRGGHDYTISKIIEERFTGKNVLIISVNDNMGKNLKEKILEKYYNKYCYRISSQYPNPNSITIETLCATINTITFVNIDNLGKSRGLNIDVIFVNCSSLLSKNQIDNIYKWAELFIKDKDVFFIIFMQ